MNTSLIESFWKSRQWLGDPHTMTHNELGEWGERLALELLRFGGHHAQPTANKCQGDIEVSLRSGSVVTFEVKTARPDKDGNYQFSLQRRKGCGANKTNAWDSDFVILFAVTNHNGVVPFVAPTAVIKERQTLKIYGRNLWTDTRLIPYRRTLENLFVPSIIYWEGDLI